MATNGPRRFRSRPRFPKTPDRAPAGIFLPPHLVLPVRTLLLRGHGFAGKGGLLDVKIPCFKELSVGRDQVAGR